MTWSGAMSITLRNQSTKDADAIIDKAAKRDFLFGFLANDDADNSASPEETYTGNVIETDGTAMILQTQQTTVKGSNLP